MVKKSFLGILALALILGFVIVSCGDKDDDGGGGVSVPDWAQGRWYSAPNTPDILNRILIAEITSSGATLGGIAYNVKTTGNNEVTFASTPNPDVIIEFYRTNNVNQIEYVYAGIRTTLYK